MLKNRNNLFCWRNKKYFFFKKFFYNQKSFFFKTKKIMKNYEIFGKKYLFKTKNISRRIGNDLYFFLDDGIYEIRSKIALLNLVCT